MLKLKTNMGFKKRIKKTSKLKLLTTQFVILLITSTAVVSITYALTVQDDYTGGLNLNEMLGSEVTGGELINEDIQSGNVLSFDGSGDYVTAGDTSDYSFPNSTGVYTVSGWFYQDVNQSTSLRYITGTSQGSSSLNGFNVYTFGTNLFFRMDLSTGTDYSKTVPFEAYKWNHFAWTGDGSTYNVYLNGKLAGSGSIDTNVANSANPMKIGGAGVAATFPWAGSISDIRIYSEALSADTIYDLYTHHAEPDDTNLEGHWKLDEGTGTTATDSSANSNDGTITSATWITGSIYTPQSRTTSDNLLTATSTLENFDYTTGKKPGDTNGRIQFSTDGTNYVNKDGDALDFGAYEFDGVNDYINNSYSGEGLSSYTLSTWVKTKTVDSTKGIVGWSKEAGVDRLNIFQRDTNKFAGLVDDGSGHVNFVEFGSPVIGEWQFLTFVYDHTTGDLLGYLNGELEGTKAGNSLIDFSPTVDFTIGAYLSSSAAPKYFYDGSISDTRIYSEALTPTDIWNLYAYSIEPDDTNLEGHWKMNGNALDSSGNGNDGTVYGAINTTDWNEIPHVGHSLLTDDEAQVSSFDGVNDYHSLSNVTAINPHYSDFSYSFWFKTSTTENAGILSKSRYGSYTSRWWAVLSYGGVIETGLHTIATGIKQNYSSGDLRDGKWHHVVSTYDRDGVMSVYVDGVLHNTLDISAANGEDISASSYVFIGAYNDVAGTGPATGYYFNGNISCVAIWHDLRTAEEVVTDYKNGWIDTTDSNLVAYYPLAGDYLDYKGSNDGTNNGSTLINDIYRPQPEEPVQRTFDISNIGPVVGDFDGVGDYVDSGSDITLDDLEIKTISAWFYADNITPLDKKVIVSKQDLSAGGGSWAVDLDTTGKIRFYQDFTSDGIWTTDSVILSGWNHIAISYNNSSISNTPLFYLNGSPETFTTSNSPTGTIGVDSSANLFIGARGDSTTPDRLWNGQISQVAIYSDVRTEPEITADYTRGYINPNDPDLVAYYPLAGDYEDHSGNGNHGTPQGTPQFINTKGAPGLVESFTYRTFFTTPESLSSSYALNEITLESTPAEFITLPTDGPGLLANTYGKQTSYATTTTDIQLGGAFSLINESATSTIESIKFDQIGTLSGDYIENLTLNYYYETASTTCQSTQPDSGLTTAGSPSDLVSGSTTITTNLDVGLNRLCIYPTYDLTAANEYTELGKSIDLVISGTSSIAVTSGEATLESTPLNIYGKTVLAQDGIQSVTVAVADGTETTIYVENQALYKKVGTADPVRLTSSDVKVIYAQFTNLSGTKGNGQVRVELRIKYDGYNYIGSEVIQNFVTTVNVGR